MKILLLNQCFHPDVAATGQYLTDLALGLTERGHSVTVITSARGYDDPSRRFAKNETWRGIRIIRIGSLNPGKEAKWRRAVNFASFLLVCSFRLLLQPRFDAVVALTSPPLISVLGALFVQLKGGKLFPWVMDLNPDEAFAAGWLRESSLPGKILAFCLKYSLGVASNIIVLDRFMKQRVMAKGITETQVTIVPPWPLEAIGYDEEGRQEFRERNDLSKKFVVMYAGNHSPCHPLKTLLDAAQQLSMHEEIAFCFVGGGSEQKKVRAFAAEHQLPNILCLPYQPLAELAGMLSAADLHTVVMGEEFVGIVHPCKIYNVLAVGSPFLYIGPDESHVTDITGKKDLEVSNCLARHSEVDKVADYIRSVFELGPAQRSKSGAPAARDFSRASLLPALIGILERAATTPTVAGAAVSQRLI